jgi:hypothetical protein
MCSKACNSTVAGFFCDFQTGKLIGVNARIDGLKLLSPWLPVIPSISYLCRPKSVFADFCFISPGILNRPNGKIELLIIHCTKASVDQKQEVNEQLRIDGDFYPCSER